MTNGDAANSPAATVVAGLAGGATVSLCVIMFHEAVSLGSAIFLRSKSDPDPTDTGGSANPSGGLANNSPASQTGHGGGTGNNTETNGGRAGGLAPGSSLSTKNYGDGGGDAGDNNRTSRAGVLASGSMLSTKDQGDGGGSDTRGGGGNSTISGSAKVVNAGGGHNQRTGRLPARIDHIASTMIPTRGHRPSPKAAAFGKEAAAFSHISSALAHSQRIRSHGARHQSRHRVCVIVLMGWAGIVKIVRRIQIEVKLYVAAERTALCDQFGAAAWRYLFVSRPLEHTHGSVG